MVKCLWHDLYVLLGFEICFAFGFYSNIFFPFLIGIVFVILYLGYSVSSNRSTDFGPVPGPPTPAGPPVLTRMAPPLPARPVQQSYRPSYSSFTSSYSPYGSSIYGGYSPYSYGSGYGGGYGLGGYSRFPHTDDIAPSRFVQQAEESSRGAFQSIESIVQAFASVSMMLDATFSAVYNSFRAVLDVANHLTRLRAHLTRVLSAFALVRTLRYLYRRLRRLLGRGLDADVEDLWADSTSDAVAATSSRGFGAGMEDQSVKSWPIILFFAVVLGGPYLIWKLLSSTSGSEENSTAYIYHFLPSHAYAHRWPFYKTTVTGVIWLFMSLL